MKITASQKQQDLRPLIEKIIGEVLGAADIELPEEMAGLPAALKTAETAIGGICHWMGQRDQDIEKSKSAVLDIRGLLKDYALSIEVLTKAIDKIEKTAVNSAPRELTVKSHMPKVPAKNFKLVHRDFERVLRWVSSRDTSGFPVPVWLWGAPGAGKTHLAAQISEALALANGGEDFKFWPISFGPTTTDSKVVGYTNAATGAYVVQIGRSWYEHGGLLYCDEIDNAEPSALVSLNALLANGEFRFPDGKLVKKHKNCFALAGANTLGTGATQGFRRQSQDAASRSRFAKVKLEYDETLENALSPIPTWTAYVQKVRKEVGKMAKSSVHITPRDAIIGAAALSNGVPANEVVDHLFSEFSDDSRRQIEDACGKFTFTA